MSSGKIDYSNRTASIPSSSTSNCSRSSVLAMLASSVTAALSPGGRWLNVVLLLLLAAPGWASLGIDATASGDQSTAKPSISTAAFSTKAGNELLLALLSSDNVSGANRGFRRRPDLDPGSQDECATWHGRSLACLCCQPAKQRGGHGEAFAKCSGVHYRDEFHGRRHLRYQWLGCNRCSGKRQRQPGRAFCQPGDDAQQLPGCGRLAPIKPWSINTWPRLGIPIGYRDRRMLRPTAARRLPSMTRLLAPIDTI